MIGRINILVLILHLSFLHAWSSPQILKIAVGPFAGSSPEYRAYSLAICRELIRSDGVWVYQRFALEPILEERTLASLSGLGGGTGRPRVDHIVWGRQDRHSYENGFDMVTLIDTPGAILNPPFFKVKWLKENFPFPPPEPLRIINHFGLNQMADFPVFSIPKDAHLVVCSPEVYTQISDASVASAVYTAVLSSLRRDFPASVLEREGLDQLYEEWSRNPESFHVSPGSFCLQTFLFRGTDGKLKVQIHLVNPADGRLLALQICNPNQTDVDASLAKMLRMGTAEPLPSADDSADEIDTSVYAWNLRGMAMERGSRREAMDAYRAALFLDPGAGDAILSLQAIAALAEDTATVYRMLYEFFRWDVAGSLMFKIPIQSSFRKLQKMWDPRWGPRDVDIALKKSAAGRRWEFYKDMSSWLASHSSDYPKMLERLEELWRVDPSMELPAVTLHSRHRETLSPFIHPRQLAAWAEAKIGDPARQVLQNHLSGEWYDRAAVLRAWVDDPKISPDVFMPHLTDRHPLVRYYAGIGIGKDVRNPSGKHYPYLDTAACVRLRTALEEKRLNERNPTGKISDMSFVIRGPDFDLVPVELQSGRPDVHFNQICEPYKILMGLPARGILWNPKDGMLWGWGMVPGGNHNSNIECFERFGSLFICFQNRPNPMPYGAILVFDRDGRIQALSHNYMSSQSNIVEAGNREVKVAVYALGTITFRRVPRDVTLPEDPSPHDPNLLNADYNRALQSGKFSAASAIAERLIHVTEEKCAAAYAFYRSFRANHQDTLAIFFLARSLDYPVFDGYEKILPFDPKDMTEYLGRVRMPKEVPESTGRRQIYLWSSLGKDDTATFSAIQDIRPIEHVHPTLWRQLVRRVGDRAKNIFAR